ncbi:hypothetical protein DXG01_016113, partial [Tephrocybe rancida]
MWSQKTQEKNISDLKAADVRLKTELVASETHKTELRKTIAEKEESLKAAEEAAEVAAGLVAVDVDVKVADLEAELAKAKEELTKLARDSKATAANWRNKEESHNHNIAVAREKVKTLTLDGHKRFLKEQEDQ